MRELIVDNFAGGGGASTGIELAIGRSVDIAINHDPAAIAMHRANHPTAKHYCESVWDVNPLEVTGGQPVALAWFSPDCKHFSRAKGSKPVDKNTRGLAWVAIKWAAMVRPRVIILENVEEFQTWGPLKGDRPDTAQRGRTFRSFVNALQRYGYKVEYKVLRACDFGAPTIRKRLFLIARCDGRSIIWPGPTHGDPKSMAVMAGRQRPWRTAAEIIDWAIPCPSIFDRRRPLAEATMRRIARGICRFVIDNPEPFIIATGHTGFSPNGRQKSVHDPLSTVVTKAEHCLVTPTLIQQGYPDNEGKRALDIEMPIGTVAAGGNKFALVSAMLTKFQQNSIGQEPDEPLHTVMAGAPRFGVVTAFLSKYFGGGYTGSGVSLDDPLHTVTAVDHHALISSHIIKLRGQNIGHAVDSPLHTVTAGGTHLGEVRAFLLKYYGQGTGQECDMPLHTIKAKDTFGLVTIHGDQHAIADIGLRMLTPRELFAAQGFPDGYIIDRDADGKAYPLYAQVARCGNAVPPPLAEVLVAANLPELCSKDAA